MKMIRFLSIPLIGLSLINMTIRLIDPISKTDTIIVCGISLAGFLLGLIALFVKEKD